MLRRIARLSKVRRGRSSTPGSTSPAARDEWGQRFAGGALQQVDEPGPGPAQPLPVVCEEQQRRSQQPISRKCATRSTANHARGSGPWTSTCRRRMVRPAVIGGAQKCRTFLVQKRQTSLIKICRSTRWKTFVASFTEALAG